MSGNAPEKNVQFFSGVYGFREFRHGKAIFWGYCHALQFIGFEIEHVGGSKPRHNQKKDYDLKSLIAANKALKELEKLSKNYPRITCEEIYEALRDERKKYSSNLTTAYYPEIHRLVLPVISFYRKEY